MKMYVSLLMLFLLLCVHESKSNSCSSFVPDTSNVENSCIASKKLTLAFTKDQINDLESFNHFIFDLKTQPFASIDINRQFVPCLYYPIDFVDFRIDNHNFYHPYGGALEMLSKQFPYDSFDLWRHYLTSRFYEQQECYNQALLHCDSALRVVKNLNVANNKTFNDLSLYKARLYEKISDTIAACKVYQKIYLQNDSIHRKSYMSNIDSLRVVYWIDQIRLDNAEARSEMLIEIIIFSILVLLLVVYIFIQRRNQNKRLVLSYHNLNEARKNASYSIQSKSMFLSNMSHELRTPLNAIVGFSGYLADNEDIDPETREQCGDLIKQNADLLIKLINDIVDLSELNDRNITFRFESCDAVVLCRNVIETIDKVKRTSAVVSFETELHNLIIDTDPGRLQQVLINLLINATKFTTEGTIKLRLELSQNSQLATFTVEDTGRGIPLDKQPNIFKRFEKLHEGIQGAGLGLSICQLIIDNIGGQIWIDSSYTNGARFVFTHPLSGNKKEM